MPSGYIRWKHDEWLRVAVNMLPRLEKGETNLVALATAMRKVIHRDRWQSDDFIAHTCQPKRALGLLKSWLDKARALPEAERNAMLVLTPAQRFALENPDAPKPVRKSQAKPDTERKLARAGVDKGRNYKGAKWTTREWALIARMVRWFQTHGVTLSLSRLVIEAQELVLDADRRRSIKGIQASVNGAGKLDKHLAVGFQNLYLVTDVPFNPPLPPGSEVEESSQPEQALEAPETAIPGDKTAEGYGTPPPPPPPHGVPLPGSLAAPTETIHSSTAAAVQKFGETMMSALDALLSSHTHAVMHSLEARLAASSSAMAAEVASMIEGGMRKAVANMLAHELGGEVKADAPQPGGITAPAPPIPPKHHNPVPPSNGERRERLKVDIVGLTNGSEEQLVRQAFGGGEVDLRFTRPHDFTTFQPHATRPCIVMSERIPHAISNKLKSAKVQPMYVKPTAGHIIHAIEELQRARSANVAH